MEDDLVADEKFCEIYKRLPTKFHTSANDVYVTRKTKVIAQFNKCKNLLDKKVDDIVIHSMGSAINQAVTLALKLENSMKNSIRLNIVTSSVNVTDDILNLLDDNSLTSHQRTVTAVHILVSRITY